MSQSLVHKPALKFQRFLENKLGDDLVDKLHLFMKRHGMILQPQELSDYETEQKECWYDLRLATECNQDLDYAKQKENLSCFFIIEKGKTTNNREHELLKLITGAFLRKQKTISCNIDQMKSCSQSECELCWNSLKNMILGNSYWNESEEAFKVAIFDISSTLKHNIETLISGALLYNFEPDEIMEIAERSMHRDCYQSCYFAFRDMTIGREKFEPEKHDLMQLLTGTLLHNYKHFMKLLRVPLEVDGIKFEMKSQFGNFLFVILMLSSFSYRESIEHDYYTKLPTKFHDTNIMFRIKCTEKLEISDGSRDDPYKLGYKFPRNFFEIIELYQKIEIKVNSDIVPGDVKLCKDFLYF
jgi:hypothetical protein